MKKINTKIALVAVGLFCAKAYSQGFVNLNFEHPLLPLSPVFNVVLTSNAIPGWTAYLSTSTATNQTDAMGYNTVSLGGAAVFLEDTNSDGLLPIQGTYSVLLQGSTADTPTAASIGQTGTIPIASQSLTFFGSIGNLQLTFNGQPLNYLVIGSTASYNIYAANISAYAGQTGQLLFTAPVNNSAMLDNILFSTTPVPEPGTLTLVALGGLLLGCRRRARC